MGFYPVTPGSTVYAIGTPAFGEVIINPGNGKSFIIKAENVSDTNIYIQSATLNGEPLNEPFIEHENIMNGGRLVFRMGPEPNKDWGREAPPPSLSD